MMHTVRVRPATSADDIAAVRGLFKAYAESLGISLAYQDFEAELAGLPGAYGQPRGALLLADDGTGAAPLGCVALRPLGALCEMKRLYVAPAGRGRGVGRALVAAVIEAARRHGYSRMRLDTLPELVAAQGLYGAFGFRPIPPYYDTPIAGTLFFELVL